jgi:hypothetical protein
MRRISKSRASAAHAPPRELPREVWQFIASMCGSNELGSLLGVCRQAKKGVYDAMNSSQPPEKICDEDGTSPFCNTEQLDAFVRVALLGKSLFLTGGAGTGKSFTTRRIVENVLSQVDDHEEVLVVCPTGAAARVASSANKTAYTIHYAFCISNVNRFETDEPYEESDVSYSGLNEADQNGVDKGVDNGVNKGVMDDPEEPDEEGKTPMPTALISRDLRRSLCRLKMLVIDECSMVSNEMFTLMDKTLRGVRDCDEPFGGVTLLCVGDFCQLPPVLSTPESLARNRALGGPWAFQSKSWSMSALALREIVRQKDPTFASVLNRIRVGSATWSDASWLNRHTNRDSQPQLSILPSHKMCTERNKIEFNRLLSAGATAVSFPTENFPTQLLSTNPWKARRLFDDQLADQLIHPARVKYPAVSNVVLCVGSRVRAVKNIYKRPSPSEAMELQIANGQRGSVQAITAPTDEQKGQVRVRWDPLRPGEEGSVYTVETSCKSLRQKWKFDDKFVYGNSTFMPLTLAWAITVHSSQGASVDLPLDLNHLVMTKNGDDWVPQAGGAYVALSRATDISHVKMLRRFHPRDAVMDSEVKRFMVAAGVL